MSHHGSQHASRSTPLEDYAYLSDLQTGALVSRHGSVDWLCLPHFDSPAAFSALLGTEEDGRWYLGVRDAEPVTRAYRGSSFTLDTTWRGDTGEAVVSDVLPVGDWASNLVRRVTCTCGTVTVEHDLRLRPDYNRSGAWIRRQKDPDGATVVTAVAGPEMLVMHGPLLQVKDVHPDDQDDLGPSHDPEQEGEAEHRLVGTFTLREGESLCWVLTWLKSWEPLPCGPDVDRAIDTTGDFWEHWAAHLTVEDHHDAMVSRSLLTLRALTHSTTGGIVAAPTASLPEELGGSRNWDYRYTWLRDASLTIEAKVAHGYTHGAKVWRDWLLRAVAGDPRRLQIMYGIDGRRRLEEEELDHLAGYENSRPVRIGNGAVDQYQADVAGEVMIALAALRDAGEPEDEWSWGLQKHLLAFCVKHIDVPDHGIWEMRGDPAFFTHGRVMLWAAFNEGLRAVSEHGDTDSVISASEQEIEIWTSSRGRLYEEIHEHGWNEDVESFVQTYGPGKGFEEVDASLLQLPHTGFIAADDPKMLATVAKIEKDLVDERGFILRYRTSSGMDGLEGHEHPFLICMGWLAEQYAASGRVEDAERIIGLLDHCANDLGLLSEEYDPEAERLVGNFPQAFSHLAYVRAVDALHAATRRLDR